MGGNNISKNVVDTTVNSFINVINETANQCVSTVAVSQTGKIEAVNGSTIIVPGAIKARQVATLNSSCYLAAVSSSKIDQAIMLKAKQQADAITTDLNLLGRAEAETIYKSVVNLGMQILNSVRNTCTAQAIASQDMSVIARNGSVIIAKEIDWDQNIKNVSTCVIDSSNVIDAKTKLEQDIAQYAKSETKSSISTIVIVVVIVIIVIVIVLGVVAYFFLKSPVASQLAQAAPMML